MWPFASASHGSDRRGWLSRHPRMVGMLAVLLFIGIGVCIRREVRQRQRLEQEKAVPRLLARAEQLWEDVPSGTTVSESMVLHVESRTVHTVGKDTPWASSQRLKPAEQEKLERVAAYCLQVLAIKPELVRAHVLLGKVRQRQGRLDESVAAWREAIRLQPDTAEGHHGLGMTLAFQDKMAEARESLLQAVQLQPDNARFHFHLGVLFWSQNRPAEAASAFQRAIDLNPKEIDVHGAMGTVLIEQGKFGEATTQFRQAVQLAPSNATTHFNLGSSLLAQSRFEEAATAFRQSIQFDPECAAAFSGLGVALRKQGQLGEALTVTLQANRLRPKDPMTLTNLGIILSLQGQLDEAAAAFREALDDRPRFRCGPRFAGSLSTEARTPGASRGHLTAGDPASTHRIDIRSSGHGLAENGESRRGHRSLSRVRQKGPSKEHSSSPPRGGSVGAGQSRRRSLPSNRPFKSIVSMPSLMRISAWLCSPRVDLKQSLPLNALCNWDPTIGWQSLGSPRYRKTRQGPSLPVLLFARPCSGTYGMLAPLPSSARPWQTKANHAKPSPHWAWQPPSTSAIRRSSVPWASS